MKANRSIPDAAVIPVLTYPDVRRAVTWLSDAFGFVERVRIGEGHRSQLNVGGGAVIVAEARGDRCPPRPDAVTHSVTVRVDDARAHCARARAAGAIVLMEATDFRVRRAPVRGAGSLRTPLDVLRDAGRRGTRGMGRPQRPRVIGHASATRRAAIDWCAMPREHVLGPRRCEALRGTRPGDEATPADADRR